MSDTENAAYEAVLTRGKVYFLGSKKFEKGEPQNISAKEKAHLEKNAVDVVRFKGEDEAEPRCKFKFKSLAKRSRKAASQGDGE